jgi:hypothetical protein
VRRAHGRPLIPVTIGGRHGRVTFSARKWAIIHAILVGLHRDQIDAHLAQLAAPRAVWLVGFA